MIEKFSKEELAQILKELGIEKSSFSKKSVVCVEQRKRIFDMFSKKVYPETSEIRPNESSRGISKGQVRKDIFDSAMVIIDYSLENFETYTNKFHQPGSYRRSTTIKDCDVEKYKKMFDEILDIIEKYHK